LDEIKDSVVTEYLGEGTQAPLEVARAVLVFGKNSATYKFSLAKTLLEFDASSEVKYGDIGQKFLKHLIEHHELCPHQHNRSSTKLTKAIDKHLAEELSWNDLFSIAEESIYNNVFEAFHTVGGGKIKESAVLFENNKSQKKLTLTESMNSLQEDNEQKSILIGETEARWRVVEEAWRKNLSPLLILDERENSFYTTVNDHRINLRSAVETLLPYQFGTCFYCRCLLDESLHHMEDQFPDVDHVMPLSLLVRQFPQSDFNPNGVWNLVISCKRCNRGKNGKFDTIPNEALYEQLFRRNVYFTKEHKHSMRFSVLKSLDVLSVPEMIKRMKDIYNPFKFIRGWTPNV